MNRNMHYVTLNPIAHIICDGKHLNKKVRVVCLNPVKSVLSHLTPHRSRTTGGVPSACVDSFCGRT